MIFTLEAQPKQTSKKSELNALRRQGMIPAVLYGKSVESTPIAIDRGKFQQCYKKSFNELAFYEIVLNGTKYHTILKDKLIHPVTRNILHIDFMVVEESAQMEFEVPIQFVGEAVGTKEGGFVDVIQRSVKITCRAKDIPEEISLDISALKVGDALHIKDLPAGNWQYKDHSDITLVVVHAKKTEEAPAAAEAPAAEEPKPEQ
ncbi:MAG: 50S ribosomal protein L25 [Candidatus Cloacimonetes bacterium]|nr:50S ribosomal protein L25 [Candidatus Cloacimonadota bacterium]MDD3142590.1 50S ribosomal protein L25 [Candidatus Cloacimonadota bacterium]MDY0367071.1 50S ribosomal protein L25 [Candidatus Syntrophosphaera sp.]HOY84450.1 50S ribosomal protein L25 [Candidatus Syntrophosphaera sp.]HPH60992.1 50S ribosomal protein L25 [Candidatus Syntrophosphaera sp.]